MKDMDVSKSIGIIQFILICLLLISINGFGQNVEFKNDTLSYRFHKYYVGKELQLGHGSSKSQLFAFIFWGQLSEPANPIDSKWAGTIVEVEEIYSRYNIYYLRCNAKGVVSKFHINIKDAVDNNELK